MSKIISYQQNSSPTNKGDSTNFPHVYYTSPSLYNEFCMAEDTEGIIFKYIAPYCTKKTTLLDIGCGTGKYVNLFAPRCKKVIGVDPVEKQLVFADRETAKRGYANVQYLLGRAENLPLLSGSVDLILLAWVTLFPGRAFREMHRVLRRKGLIVRVSPYAKDDLTALFPDLNLERMERKNRWFQNHCFTTTYKSIQIKFSSIRTARHILSRVVGSRETGVIQRTLKHSVVIQTYVKNA